MKKTKDKVNNLITKFKSMDNKKSILMGAIGVLTLLVFVVGATYAYFSAQSNSGARTDVDVITGTTDLLSFSFGDLINIQANEENFGQGMGNLSDDTTGTAILRANNTTNSVTTRYNIYLVIESNNFEYTTEEGTPEILLNVTDPNGNKVENITGLVHYEDGFDITTRTGGFLLVPDYVISATDTQTVQDWNIEVTFVNLDSDQQANTNKSLTGKLYMTQDTMSSYELTEINNINATTTYNSIDATLELTNGSGAVEKYYYGIEKSTNTRSSSTVEYIESNEPTYKFENLEPETEYTIYSYVEDENKIKSNIYSTNITTNELILPTIDSVTHSVTLNSITVNVTACGGSKSGSTYLYKIDDEEWIETESSTYTFNNLLDSTEYDIRIKVKDIDGYESTEYYEAITTEVYILPVVTTVEANAAWNSITLTPTGADGTNTIDHYEYSIDNGEYQESNVFNNLTENTEYIINVKAIDSAGRESNPYTLQVTTDEYVLPVVNNVTTSSTSSTITINVNATGNDGNISTYHYSRDDGSNYTESTNNSYTFTNLSPNTTYYIKVYVTDSNGRVSGEYALTADTLIPDVMIATTNTAYGATPATLSCSNATATYNQKYSRVQISQVNRPNRQTGGNCTLTYQTPSSINYLNNYIIGLAGTTQGTGQVVNENGYRYEGKNPNNYVWFNNELWRIIGVFDENSHGQSGQNLVKIIRNDSIGGLAWHKSNTNDWTAASLMNLLNGAYLNSENGTGGEYCYGSSTIGVQCDYTEYGINDTYRPMIENVTWYLGGYSNAIATAEAFYGYERGDKVYSGRPTSTTGYIGLMYPSDYGYSVLSSSCARTTNLVYYDTSSCAGQSWMYGQGVEWTITPFSSKSNYVFYVRYDGSLRSERANIGYAARPVLYLDSNVYVIDGTGTQSDPYIIGM